MDFSLLLSLLPTTYVGYASAIISVASVLAPFVPAKTAVGKVLHFVALNFGHAKSISAEDVPTQPLAPIVEVPVNK